MKWGILLVVLWIVHTHAFSPGWTAYGHSWCKDSAIAVLSATFTPCLDACEASPECNFAIYTLTLKCYLFSVCTSVVFNVSLTLYRRPPPACSVNSGTCTPPTNGRCNFTQTFQPAGTSCPNGTCLNGTCLLFTTPTTTRTSSLTTTLTSSSTTTMTSSSTTTMTSSWTTTDSSTATTVASTTLTSTWTSTATSTWTSTLSTSPSSTWTSTLTSTVTSTPTTTIITVTLTSTITTTSTSTFTSTGHTPAPVVIYTSGAAIVNPTTWIGIAVGATGGIVFIGVMLWYRRRTVPPRVPPERIEVWVQPLTDADGHAKLYDLGRGGTTEAEYMQWDMIPLDIFVEGSSNLDEEDQLSNGPSLHTDYIDVDNDTT